MKLPGKTQAAVDAEALVALKASIRSDRDTRLQAAIGRRDRYRDQLELGNGTDDTAEAYAAILAYIQALRDVPEQAGFPQSVTWPIGL